MLHSEDADINLVIRQVINLDSKAVRIKKNVVQRADRILDRTKNDIKEKEKVKYISSFLKNELFSKGFDNFSDSVYIELNKLERIHSSKAQEEDLQILKEVTLKLKNVIDEIFGRTSNIKLERVLKENIELNNDVYVDDNKRKSLLSG